MAVSPNSLITVQTPQRESVQILNATGTALVTAYTAGANGSKIVAAFASSTDTAPQNITIGITHSATFFALGTTTVPAGAGTVAGTPPVDLLAVLVLPVDNDGQKYFFLVSGDTLQVQSAGTVTAAKAVNVTAIGGDF